MANRNYWAVGATFSGTEDASVEFKEKGIWYDGYAKNGDDRNIGWFKVMHPGDVLIMKSSSTKGPGHSTSFTKVKGIGILLSNIDYYHFKVKWLDVPGLPKDFDNISYRNTIERLRNDVLFDFVKPNVIKFEMTNILSLLKFKKQIILQGPPGTGKTKLAKELAMEMTRGETLGNSMQIIDAFFKDQTATTETLEKRMRLNGNLARFRERFPKDKLNNMPVQDYAFGNGDNNSFCWWIEYGLGDLGRYSGQAKKFKIYWSNKTNGYAKSGFVKDINDDDKAMKCVAEQVYNTANQIKLDETIEKLSKGFVLKILHCYNPDTYFPVNNEHCIDNILKVLSINPTGLSIFDKNKRIQVFFSNKKNQFNADVTNIEFMYFLFEKFDLKGEIVLQENAIVTKGDYKLVQFHPSYSYEDFVRGIVAETTENSQLEYNVVNKIMAAYAQRAMDNPSSNYVLIIDEINRANLSSVLGELIYALEYRDETVESIYEFDESNELLLPPNLYIIGTMNTADRSVGHIDYAIRRRFAFVDVMPRDLSVDLGDKFHKELFESVAKMFNHDTNLSKEFDVKDVQLGHSYFIDKSEKGGSMTIRLEYEIKPILREYVKDGILIGESIREKIENLQA